MTSEQEFQCEELDNQRKLCNAAGWRLDAPSIYLMMRTRVQRQAIGRQYCVQLIEYRGVQL